MGVQQDAFPPHHAIILRQRPDQKLLYREE